VKGLNEMVIKKDSQELINEMKQLEKVEYGLKELITGLLIGIIIGFILAVLFL